MKKRFLLTSVLMLLLTVMALSTATYAWFSMSFENFVNEFTVTTVSSSGGLEISLDGTAWSSKDVTLANPSLKALDVTTGDGIHFYKGGDNASADTALEAANTDEYFEFKLYFRTTSAGDVYLELADSYILPADYASHHADVDETVSPAYKMDAKKFVDYANNENWYNAETDNKSSNGDFSRDWIAAATRISFQLTGVQTSTYDKKTNGEFKTSVVTVPAVGEEGQVGYVPPVVRQLSANSAKVFDNLRNVQLKYNTVDGAYSIINSGLLTASSVRQVVADENDGNKLKANGDLVTFNSEDGGIKELFTNGKVKIFTIAQTGVGQTFDGTYVEWKENQTMIAEVTCRVWIEGQDEEAQLPLTSGEFTTALHFSLTENKNVEKDPRIAISVTGFTPSADGFNWSSVPAGVIKYEIYNVDPTSEGATPIATINPTAAEGTYTKAGSFGYTTVSGTTYYLVATLDNLTVGGTGIYKDGFKYYFATDSTKEARTYTVSKTYTAAN